MKKRKQTQEPEAPPKVTIYTEKLNPEQMERLRIVCERKSWDPYDVAYASFAFKGPKINVVGYQSGKVVIQGKETEEFIVNTFEPEVTQTVKFGYDEVLRPEWFEPHAGLDESGKGDFFGPVICACVIAEKKAIDVWREAGIRDSKKIGDAQIERFAQMIRKTEGVVSKVVFCGMAKYNELMGKPRANLNLLLAWQHAKALDQALTEKWVPWGMLDQFSKQPLVQRYFKRTDFDLRMQTKAEEDPVVAAASILARAEYVRQIQKLSERFGEPLQKGASARVREQGVQIIEKFGPQGLKDFAKLHFRTAHEVVAAAGKTGEIDLPPLKPAYERR
jgi:ribonuclease HIII